MSLVGPSQDLLHAAALEAYFLAFQQGDQSFQTISANGPSGTELPRDEKRGFIIEGVADRSRETGEQSVKLDVLRGRL